MAIVETANHFVKFMGLYKGMTADLQIELDELPENQRFEHIKEELIQFVGEEQEKVKEGERLLGSSEIIESVIGKYKGLQQDQVKGGFTGMLLGLAASVSDLKMDTIINAINSIPTKKVWQWIKRNVGNSVYSQRKEFNKTTINKEQNLEENLRTISG